MPDLTRFTLSSPVFLRKGLFSALLALLAAGPLAAQVDFPEPNWSASAAHAAAGQVDANALLAPLYDKARQGRDAELLAQLQSVAADARLPVPARERVLFDFARGLGELPPGAIGPDVLHYLQGYRPRTLVPHPDSERVGTPLFNIAAATAGALNAWSRQTGYVAGRTLLAEPAPHPADRFLAEFERASEPRRQGLADALPLAGAEQLADLAAQSLAALPNRPGLGPVALRTSLLVVLRHGDPVPLQRALATASGAEVADLLAETGARLDEPGRLDLLLALLDTAAPTNAALAVGVLAPGLLHRPELADRLFVLLGDPTLGSAAALVLSQSARPDLNDRLRETAAGDDLAATRAALALSAGRVTAPGGGR